MNAIGMIQYGINDIQFSYSPSFYITFRIWIPLASIPHNVFMIGVNEHAISVWRLAAV